jgi:starch phosphorylase
VKRSLASLGPQVVATRMVRDYAQALYEPTAARTDALSVNGYERARALAAWKARVREAWHAVHVDRVDTDEGVADMGSERTVEAVVALGTLHADDVEVQLIHGPAGQGDELSDPTVVAMEPAGAVDSDHARYRGAFTCDTAGRYGFTVRVVPSHADLVAPAELGRIAWA